MTTQNLEWGEALEYYGKDTRMERGMTGEECVSIEPSTEKEQEKDPLDRAYQSRLHCLKTTSL